MPAKQNPNDPFAALYRASAEPEIVDVPQLDFASVTGVGDPAISPDYQAAVAALYAYSYPVVIALNKTSEAKLKVGPLEGLWWSDDFAVFDPTAGDRSRWHWRMMIRQPGAVPDAIAANALAKVTMKLGADVASRLAIEPFSEGRAAQLLHVGPYTEEGPDIARLHAHITAAGLTLRGHHHEIYLNDPNKTPGEKLRTILRQPVA